MLRDVDADRRETDRTLREERERTDRALAGEPVEHAEDTLEQVRADAEARLREVREDVDAHLDRQAEILPKIAEALEGVADSMANAATSLTADTSKSPGGATAPAAERIQRAASVMERLIVDLLDFASFEDSHLRVAASLTFEAIAPPAPVTAIFDPDRMLQVVANVLQTRSRRPRPRAVHLEVDRRSARRAHLGGQPPRRGIDVLHRAAHRDDVALRSLRSRVPGRPDPPDLVTPP